MKRAATCLMASAVALTAATHAFAEGPAAGSYAPAPKESIVSSLATITEPAAGESATPGISLPGASGTPETALHVPAELGLVPCPAIPDADDLDLTADELARIETGEIVLRIIEDGNEDRQVRAIGYLDADPVTLFDYATDSSLAPKLVSMVKRVDVLEQSSAGKTLRGTAKPSMLLPTYRYTLNTRYRADRTGQCWGQLEGDFDRNEGAHSFLWDAEREQTLAVFTFYFSLRGVLSLVPESWVLNGAATTLPDFMRKLETLAKAESDPARMARNGERWGELRARLESGASEGRVWRSARAQARR